MSYCVCTIFRLTPESTKEVHTAGGRSLLTFAADLVRQLDAAELRVYLPGGNANEQALMNEVGLDANQQFSRVRQAVKDAAALPDDQINIVPLAAGQETIDFPANAILIAQDIRHTELDVLVPFDESSLDCRQSDSPILISFGSGESGLYAASIGIPLAKKLGRKIVFYHTTWKDDTKGDAPAHEHMCTAARNVCSQITALAGEAGVGYETVIETADEVVDGLIRCAMRVHACLIVMSSSLKTDIGNYSSQVLEQSTIPFLTVSRRSSRYGDTPDHSASHI